MIAPKRRWWQFSLKSVFVLTLIVAAYFAGRSPQVMVIEDLKYEVRIEKEQLAAERKILQQEIENYRRMARTVQGPPQPINPPGATARYTTQRPANPADNPVLH